MEYSSSPAVRTSLPRPDHGRWSTAAC